MNVPEHAPLDAFRLEILSNALNAITEEIQLTLLRSAYSQIVKEAQDASGAIFTADGRIVAQPVVIPGHLGSMRMGGSRSADGADAVSTGTSNAMNIPAESIEMDYPVRIVRYELVPDSGGSGAHRGGLGLLREYEMLAESATVNVRGDRAVFAPRGFYGGADGSFSTFYLLRSDGSTEKIPSKYSDRIKRGERLRIMTPGGAGFGEPGKRDRDALRDDYLNGKLSPERIEREYGVKLTALTE